MENQTLKAGSALQGGKYVIRQFLRQGGFGITYLAEQVSLGRKVAVKEFFMKELCNRDSRTSHVSVPSTGSKELVSKFREKFIREARMIASFDNPHIVKIHNVFEENGTAYYVMEYLSGGSLKDMVESKGSLNCEGAVKFIKEISDALSYIHSQGTLHLDVKPSNVLLNRKGEAVLIDFGISKHYDESGQQTSSTPVGISKGYAPLEQSRTGDVSQFTPSADIYALGATLYNLVTGQTPPEASIVNEDGIPPLPSGISLPVKSAITAAMQPKRKDRPQSVAEFLRILDEMSTATDDTDLIDIKKPQPPKPEPSVPPVSDPVTPKRSVPRWLIQALCVVAAIAVGGIVTVKFVNGGGYEPEPVTDTISVHEYVDLGLPSGLIWATCNVGASSPSDYGDYYAWGETSPKSDYRWSNLKYCNDNTGDSFSKYNRDQAGTKDNKMKLELSDDAARASWGGNWRMPTEDEWVELKNNCIWIWTSQSGHNGYKVTGKNGNSIFLPAASERIGVSLGRTGKSGGYWSSSLYSGESLGAYYCWFDSSGVRGVFPLAWDYRFHGHSVRPVRPVSPLPY